MSLPLPPGRSGLPFLGELPKILEDAYGFVEERTQRYGPIFRTSILGRPAAVIVGPDASGKFIDEADIQRAGAMPTHVQTLFGGRWRSATARRRGAPHAQAAHHASVHPRGARVVPAEARGAGGELVRAVGGGELRWVPELKRLAVEAICTSVVGLTDATTISDVVADYNRIIAGFSALPVPLPGAAYARGEGGAPARARRVRAGGGGAARASRRRRSLPHARRARRRRPRSTPTPPPASSTTW
jgi:hypothetical protein